MGEIVRARMGHRYGSLDGLRGLASVVVLIHHCLLVAPQLSDAVDGNLSAPAESWVWWLTFTPVHILWAGHEAVYVFFVLSGFVLALPMLQAPHPSWTAYYVRRLLRLYLPVWASLGFASLTVGMVPRVASPQLSTWTNLHDEPANALADATLIGGTGYLNSPLWSLQWEMLFSLLLPLYVLMCRLIGRFWAAGIFVLVVCVGIGNLLNLAFPVYMSMFGIGSLMACGQQELQKCGQKFRLDQWVCWVVIALLGLCTKWLFPQSLLHIPFASLGAAALVFAFISGAPFAHIDRFATVRWLGERSFSLYVIHEPVILAIAFGTGADNAMLVLATAIPVSLAAAELFFRLVEKPSHNLASATGRLIESLVERRAEFLKLR